MGLSPRTTEVGDVMIEVRSKGRVVWLVLREEISGANSNDVTQHATSDARGMNESYAPMKIY